MSVQPAPHHPLLVVTDLMGTTLRDEGAVLPAYRAAFAECAIPFTEDELAAKRGAHKLSLFTEFAARRYPSDEAGRRGAAALKVFEKQLRHFLASGGGTPIDGAEAAIARLRQAGIKVALTSGFDRGLIAHIVRHCGWGELFDAVVYPDEVPAGRPAPYLIFQAMQKTRVEPVARVAAIGDTALDLQAGTNAGAGWVIGVLSGAHDAATLGRTPHTHLLASIAALPALLGLG
ncbi:MAG: HAD hydrolase-like protein [Alphaproteobacteria bacterium]|nr:HAD hydrolase-like protein [Alphaproteobacteria bacterium]